VHELSIAQEILAASHRAVAEHGRGRLERVQVAVGELTALEPDLLRFAWEAVTADSPDAGCAIEIEWRRAHQHCPRCAREIERPVRGWLPVCPRCGEALRVEGGQELDLLQVTFASDDEAKGVGDD
jgi:hydrogenase nickel incorporation protein HypA/HybF